MENKSPISRMVLLIILLVVVIIGGIYYFYYSGYFQKPQPTKTETTIERARVTVGLHGDILGFFPKGEDEELSFSVSRHIFEPLVSLDKGMKIVLTLAEDKYNVDENTWRFKLRKNVKFHDGTPFTAADVKFSIDQALKNEWPSASYLGSVDSVNVVDDYTVEIKTKGPNPILLNQLANVLIVSKKYKDGEKPNGTGPYLFSERVEGDHITLTANPNYYAGAPKVKTAVFKIIEDEKERVGALLSKKVDIIYYGVKEDATSEIKADSELQVKTTPSVAVNVLIINASEKSPFKDVKVRQATYQAINIQKVIAKSVSKGEAASQLVPKIVFGFNSDIKRPAYDPTAAKKLLAEAGFPNGFSVTLDDAKGSEPIDQEIADQLGEVGIKVTLNLMEREAIMEKVMKKRETTFLKGSFSSDTGDASDALALTVHSPDEEGIYGMMNFGYTNASVNSLIEQASKTVDQTKRRDYLQQAMKTAMDEVAVIPLYILNYNFGLDKNLVWEPRANRMIYVFEMAGKS